MKLAWLRPVLALVILLLMATVAVSMGWLDHLADLEWQANWLAEHPLNGVPFLLLFGAAFTALGGPRQVVAFSFGFLFGVMSGVLLALLASLLGAMLCYLVVRLVLPAQRALPLPQRLQPVVAALKASPFWVTLSIRLFPVGSNLVTNLMAGSLHIALAPFLFASLLGYLPQTVIFSLAGSGLGSANEWQLLASGVMTVISAAILYRLRQVHGARIRRFTQGGQG